MSERRWRILIVGSYGVFGGRIVELLAGEQQLELVVAGRSLAQAQAFCARLNAQAALRSERFDRAGDVTAQIRTLAPDIVVDASGPFQAYGDDLYRLVQAAVTLGVNYLDLADGSGFVGGITQFDAVAKEKGVFVLSGVSSFQCSPPPSAGNWPRAGPRRHDHWRHRAIALRRCRPQRDPCDRELRRKPLRPVRTGRPATGYGLTGTMRATIGPPGRLPLRSTLFSS
jgi:hypothetical protein